MVRPEYQSMSSYALFRLAYQLFKQRLEAEQEGKTKDVETLTRAIEDIEWELRNRGDLS